MSWDKLDYKELAREGKLEDIASHLDRKLTKIEWRYETSQKEEEIVEC